MANKSPPPPPPSDLPPPIGNVALIAGATGMVGYSLASALKEPSCPGSPWTVYAFARRPPPPDTGYPPVDSFFLLDALNPCSTTLSLSPISCHVTHLFYLALAARPIEHQNIADNSSILTNTLAALLSSPNPRLRHVTLQTGTKHYMGPNLVNIAQLEVPFREDSPRLTGPNFYYALEDILSAHSITHRYTWTVHRSSIILGASSRSAYNILLTFATYALIGKRLGEPFAYPGTVYTWRHFCDATDADVLAEQQIWAGLLGPGVGSGEAFNCTNGDVYTWRGFWKVMAAEFGVDFVECESDGEGESWVDRMVGRGEVWDEIVAENGLVQTRLEEITCFAVTCAVLKFGFQHVSSMNKSREFGFYKTADTLKSVRKWVGMMREMNIIPKL